MNEIHKMVFLIQILTDYILKLAKFMDIVYLLNRK